MCDTQLYILYITLEWDLLLLTKHDRLLSAHENIASPTCMHEYMKIFEVVPKTILAGYRIVFKACHECMLPLLLSPEAWRVCYNAFVLHIQTCQNSDVWTSTRITRTKNVTAVISDPAGMTMISIKSWKCGWTLTMLTDSRMVCNPRSHHCLLTVWLYLKFIRQ